MKRARFGFFRYFLFERFGVSGVRFRFDVFLRFGVCVVGDFGFFRAFFVGVKGRVVFFGGGRFDGAPTVAFKGERLRRRVVRKRNKKSDKERQNARSATRDGTKRVPKGAASARRGVGGGENDGFHNDDFKVLTLR
jgi:hypothetical protein